MVIHLDLGRSTDIRHNFRPVSELLGDGLPVDAMMFGGPLVLGLGGWLIETQEEDYVRTARGKGLGALRAAVRHALPSSLPATAGLAGAYAPLLVGNALLVEIVFNVPGVFRALPRAFGEGDFPLIQGLIVAGAILVALTNPLADLFLAWLDPRTRTG